MTELFKKELLKEIANVAELEDNLNFSLADFQGMSISRVDYIIDNLKLS